MIFQMILNKLKKQISGFCLNHFGFSIDKFLKIFFLFW